MRERIDPPVERKREMAWLCPRCGRIFRHHVFSQATPASGPICNACCVELEWAVVEAEVKKAKAAFEGWILTG